MTCDTNMGGREGEKIKLSTKTTCIKILLIDSDLPPIFYDIDTEASDDLWQEPMKTEGWSAQLPRK